MNRIDIRKRDGLARTGTWERGGGTIRFPWAIEAEELFPDLKELRHTCVPLQAGKGFVERYHSRGKEPLMVHPLSCDGVESGSIVGLPNWHTALLDPPSYVRWLVDMKDRIPPDTLWYAPASALPSNVALLVYSGLDLFDLTAVDLATVQKRFCIPEGEFPASLMEEGVCACGGCREGDLGAHNRGALLRELALVRGTIGSSRLREHLEMRSRASANIVAVLRLLDREYRFMERHLPVARKSPLLANSAESLNRAEVRRFAERVTGRYIPPEMRTAVLLPCSARKPYSRSQSHQKFTRVVRRRAHELIVTSPLGLVPRELERTYPAAHYDVPVTGHWDREELAFVSTVIGRYLRRHRYRRVIAHLEGGAMEAAVMGAEIAGIELETSCTGHCTSAASLNALEAMLDGEPAAGEEHTVTGMISWQFGVKVELQALLRRKGWETGVWRGETKLFSLAEETGLLAPTFEGWKLLGDVYRVTIDDYVPQGDVLAPGILDADEEIREGDEVLVVGPSAIATGRAAMGAAEMKRSRRGVAIRLRKVLKYR